MAQRGQTLVVTCRSLKRRRTTGRQRQEDDQGTKEGLPRKSMAREHRSRRMEHDEVDEIALDEVAKHSGWKETLGCQSERFG